jgi:hypothetical protein
VSNNAKQASRRMNYNPTFSRRSIMYGSACRVEL